MLLLPILCVLLLAAPVFGAGRDFPALTGRVVDNAGLFSQAEQDELTRTLADLEAATTNQFVVATIQSTNDDDINDYTAELGHYWKLGLQGKDNGAVLLVAVQDRKVAIQVGYGLEPVLTDGTCGEIIREQILPFFKQGDYFSGVKAGLAAMMAKAAPEFQPSFATGLPAAPARSRESSPGMIVVFIIIFVIFSLLGSVGSRGRNRRYWHGRGFSSGGGWFSGGGGGGWSSGGGGGFSGGGGGFGGGGASGGW